MCKLVSGRMETSTQVDMTLEQMGHPAALPIVSFASGNRDATGRRGGMACSRNGKYGHVLWDGVLSYKSCSESEQVSMATSAAQRGLFPPRLGTKVSLPQCHYDCINQTMSCLSLMTRKLPYPMSILSVEVGTLEAIYTSFVFLWSHMCTICPLLARCLRGSMNHTVILNY